MQATEPVTSVADHNLSLHIGWHLFGTPFSLLGSSYDPGTANGLRILPGSELIGNNANDTIMTDGVWVEVVGSL